MLDALRQMYNAAFDTHRECIRQIHAGRLKGEQPSAALIEQERASRIALGEARSALLAAMTGAVLRDGDSDDLA
jgi:hypothetical protein